jgi:hypothetical protein
MRCYSYAGFAIHSHYFNLKTQHSIQNSTFKIQNSNLCDLNFVRTMSTTGDSDSSRTLIDEPADVQWQLPFAPPGYDPTPISPVRPATPSSPVHHSPVRPSPVRHSVSSPLSDSETRDVPVLPFLHVSPVRHRLRPCDVLYSWNPYTSMWQPRRMCSQQQRVFLDELDSLFRAVIPVDRYVVFACCSHYIASLCFSFSLFVLYCCCFSDNFIFASTVFQLQERACSNSDCCCLLVLCHVKCVCCALT